MTSNLLRKTLITYSTNFGMLFLRLSVGIVLFLRHGWEKRPAQWAAFSIVFPDPLGIGRHQSLLFAFVGDFVCSILLIAGLGTRWAALYSFGNILVAWALVHHFAFFGDTPRADHGELIVLYLGTLLALIVAGGGTISMDNLLHKR